MTGAGSTISPAADALGLTVDTLRYYERDELLLRAVPRDASGNRRYAPTDLDWIVLVTRLRATGMPIREIRRYAALVRDGAGNEVARLELLQRHRERVLAKLAEVGANLAAIDHKIDIYAGRLSPGVRSA